jgi:hypothetical protein
MKRKLKWLAIVLAVSLLGFGTALLLWPRDRITAESWYLPLPQALWHAVCTSLAECSEVKRRQPFQ